MLTQRGKEIVLKMRQEAQYFYDTLYKYLDDLYSNGNSIIENHIEK